MGGSHITNDLAICLKTDLDLAELIKVKHSSLDKKIKGETSFVRGGQELRFEREMMRLVIEARLEEIMDYVDKEFKKIHRSKKLPGGVVLVGATAKMPGIAEFVRDTLELPARVGSWKHIGKVVDGMDELSYSTAVGLMLLDMYLGPVNGASQSGGGWLDGIENTLSNLLNRFRGH
jgi:cell division protein FtsA